MKVSSISGDLLVKVALALVAVGAVYYVTKKAAGSIADAAQYLADAPGAMLDAGQEWWAETVDPVLSRPDENESPVSALAWDAEAGILKYGPLGATGLPQLAVKGWGLIADALAPNSGGATGSW